MRLAVIAVCLAACGAANTVASPAPTRPGAIVATERAIETQTSALLLPTSTGGTLGVLTCPTCPGQRYSTDAQTAYYLGTAPVALKTLSAAITVNHSAAATVFINVQNNVVTRVVANLPANARP